MSIFLLLILHSLFSTVSSTHFLGGTITWRWLNGSATSSVVTIAITQTYLWTSSIMLCNDTMVISRQPVMFSSSYGRLNTLKLDCISNCPNGSLNYTAPPVQPLCLAISPAKTIVTGGRSDTVDLTLGDDFTVAYRDYAWRAVKSASSATWALTMRIKLTLRSDNRRFNNAPVVTPIAPVDIPVNRSMMIPIQITDVDGDTIRCRWSTNSTGVNECGQVCPPGSLPRNTIVLPGCTVIITGEAIGDWHVVTVMVRSFTSRAELTELVFFLFRVRRLRIL